MTLQEKLAVRTEMNPDTHDGAYQLVRETVNALSRVNPKDLGIEDLDMLYLMGIGTWTSSYQNKKLKIDNSHLKQELPQISDLFHFVLRMEEQYRI